MSATAKPDIPFARPLIGQAEKDAVAAVLSGHILTHGPVCAEFERRFAALIGTRHAVTTSSCTTALHLSLWALGVDEGDEVVVPAMTHVATAHVVEHCRATPIFVDSDATTGNISVERLATAITPRTKAIMAMHYVGLPCEMDAIHAAAAAAGGTGATIAVIEDCATAIGASYDGKTPGAIGSTGCFSFYPAKHITAMEGGMLTTNDDDIAWRVRKQRAFGYDRNLNERATPGVYDIVALGHNFRMSEAQAAVGLAQLDRLDGFLSRRRANSDALRRHLQEIDEVLALPQDHGKSRSGLYCLNIVPPRTAQWDRNRLVHGLAERGIGASVHYPVPIPLTTYYRDKYPPGAGAFPVAQWFADNVISLPIGPHLDEGDMARIADGLKAAIRDTKS